MKILVTGGNGFVGKHLAAQLRARKHDVWTCDVSHVPSHQSIRCDVAEYRQLSRVLEAQKFDCVYHLAAEFGRWNGEDYYENLWRTNVVGTKNLLRLQEGSGFRLVFFSSSEVYGDWNDVMSEDVMDRFEVRQLNDYAITKWVGELQVMNSARAFGGESVRVRLFNLYGPGESPTSYRSALARFIHSGLTGKPIQVHQGHTRSWLYIDDAVTTLANITDQFVAGEVYNIGSEESITMEQLADLVVEATQADPTLLEYASLEPHTTRQKKVDCSKAERDLGHTVSVDLREGIGRTTEWMRSMSGFALEAEALSAEETH